MTGPAGLENGREEIERARSALAFGVMGAVIFMVMAPLALRFRVDFASYYWAYLAAAAVLVLLPYAARRQMHTLRSALELGAVVPLLALPILVATYCAMRFNMPIADPTLLALDRAFGFDWPAMIRTVDGMPLLQAVLEQSYALFSTELLVLPMLLSLARLEARAYQFALAFLLLGFLAALISIFFPSYGAYVAHGFDPATLRNIDPHYANFFLESFVGVREQKDFTLSAGNVAGIITFPSVHAGVALLCIWATWPSRLLRYPSIVVNGLMFTSALTHGGHFLVDLFGGTVLALLCIPASLFLCRRERRPAKSPPTLVEPIAA